MLFFEDILCKSEKNLNIGITNLLENITTKPGSHKGGWARILKCQLNIRGYSNVKILDNKDSINDFDVIIFDLGAEFKGAVNLFGGLGDKHTDRLEQLRSFSGKLFSWKNKVPDVTVLDARRHNSSTCERFKLSPTTLIPSVKEKLDSCITFDHVYRTSSLLIGDSHTASVWNPFCMIERRDGRTLEGMAKHKTITKYINKFKESDVEIKLVNLHCSSIDIRHHLMREQDPISKFAHIMAEIYNELDSIDTLKNIVLMETMGIEDESRKLPKTGYYKGTPYFGTWEERNNLRKFHLHCLNEFSKSNERFSSVSYPKEFFDESGKLKFEVMEVPGSVHLSPEFYRTNLDTGEIRW